MLRLKQHMASHELHQQIDSRLKQLIDIHREMQQHAASIPYAEIDLFLQKVRQLYEASLLLHHHNALKTMEELESAIAERYAKQPDQARVQVQAVETVKLAIVEQRMETVVDASLISADQIPVPAEITKAPEVQITPILAEIPAEPVNHTMDELIVATSQRKETLAVAQAMSKPKKASGDLHEMFDEVPTLAGKFEDIETLGERIATHQSSPRIGEKHQRKPVRDLKVAIGINEKFQFINQLFAGDATTYHSTIEHLNTCPSYEAASGYLKDTLLPKYQWDISNSPATIFIDLVERRFLA